MARSPGTAALGINEKKNLSPSSLSFSLTYNAPRWKRSI
jgi:hypothetical protein